MNKHISRLRSPVAAFMHDLLIVPFAWLGAFWLRFNIGTIPGQYLDAAFTWLPLVVIVQVGIFILLGLYRGVWRFASLPDLMRIMQAVVMGTALSVVVLFLLNRLEYMPRSVFPAYGVLLFFGLGVPRFLYRWVKDHKLSFVKGSRALIVGAGRAGEMLARDLLRDSTHSLMPVGFVDDKYRKRGLDIQGIRVLGPCDQIGELVERMDIDLVLIAIPSANSQQMRKIVKYCGKAKVPFRTLPRMGDLVSGEVTIQTLRKVSIEDLLGRETVKLDWAHIKEGVMGKQILITGGGGSIGSELCRQIARLNPLTIIITDQSEFNLYSIEKELSRQFPEISLKLFLMDVTDKSSVEHVYTMTQPSIVFHAAAYKHVPMIEGQLREGIFNNVLGTRNCAVAADQHGCECFVLISTDKAVNPANVMGATKRSAEIYCQNLNKRSSTHFITVRFGNVLDSAGSVVPLFREQIVSGGPVTITHPEIKRYFMTITEATQLILQAGAMGKGGEIFVLNMGEPVKISYLAKQMIRLSGKVPGTDIDIVYTGLRPGEKLFEELFHEQEQLVQTSHPKIFLARHRKENWARLNDILEGMEAACESYDDDKLKQLLNQLVPEWHSDKASREPSLQTIPITPVSEDDENHPILH